LSAGGRAGWVYITNRGVLENDGGNDVFLSPPTVGAVYMTQRRTTEESTRGAHAKPSRLFAVAVVSILVGEGLVMLLFTRLPFLSAGVAAVLDAVLITALMLPALYVLLYRPLVEHGRLRERAESELRTHLVRTERMLAISDILTATTDVNSLSENIVRSGRSLLALDGVTLRFQVDTERTIQTCSIIDRKGESGPGSLPSVDGLGDYVVRNSAFVTVDYFASDERFGGPFDDGVVSAIGAPLTVEGRTVGVLTGCTETHRSFSETDRLLFETLANGAAVALQNAVNLEDLAYSEKKFRDLYDRAPAMYHSLDRRGIVVECNATEARTLGYPKSEIIGRPFTDFLTPESAEAFREQFAGLDPAQPVVTVEREFRRHDGSTFPARLNVFAEFDETGGLVGTKTIARDITERKLLEEETLKARKLESLGSLAGGIAHDFNNLLTGIMGNISLIKLLSAHTPKIHERASQAETACRRARVLTQRLLTFAHGGEPVKENVSLADLVENEVSFTLKNRPIRYSFSRGENLPRVNADPGQMSQVFHSIALNAVEAMPEGGSVSVDCESCVLPAGNPFQLRSGTYVRVRIRDTGPGIQSGNIGRIFDPYFSTKKKGSGLGLAMAHSVVSKHGGHLGISSPPEGGTTVDVLLPAIPAETEPADKTEPSGSVKGARILVMDDEEIVRDVARELLTTIGCVVDTAGDGRAAVELFQAARDEGAPYAAVILDLTVPDGMGGIDTLAALKEIDPAVSAIVSSGYADDPAMARYRDYGFCDVMAKPYHAEDLSAVIFRVLSRAAAD